MWKDLILNFWEKHKSFLKWFILVTYTFLLFNISSISASFNKVLVLLTPFVYGFALAYLLNPLVMYIERFISKIKWNMLNKRSTGISIFLAYYITTLLVIIFLLVVVPEVVASINGIMLAMPEAIKELTLEIVDFMNRNLSEYTDKVYNEKEALEHMNRYTTELLTYLKSVLPQIFEITLNMTSTLFHFILGYIVSIYMLLHKDKYKGQIKKIIVAYTSENQSKTIFEVGRNAHKTFSDFITIKILNSILVGIICYISCLVLKIDNALLIAVVIGVTNVIPYFGPFIGAIPTSLIVLFDSPLKMVLYIIFIILLQQFEGNYLEPKLLGNKLGLNSLLVIFAVVMMSGILGVVGMFIGVPLFAIIYMYMKKNLERTLERKGKSTDTRDYM